MRAVQFLFAIIVIYSCRSKQSNVNKKSIFHYNQTNPITSLDPAFAKSQNNYWVCDHLFNQLLDLNDSMQIIPEIATSFVIDNAAKVYTFKLRTDIYFIDNPCFENGIGRLLTAHDVVFSFQRLLDPVLSAPGRWIFIDKVDSIHPFIALNDSVFVLNLSKAFAPMLSLLTMHYCSIIPMEAIEYYGDKFRENPVGTGPFSMIKWVDRQGLFLKKNSTYFKKGLPLLDGVRVSFIEDRNTAYLEFMKGRIDFFSGIHSSFAPQLLNKYGELRDDRRSLLKLLKGNYLNTEYIGINLTTLPEKHILKNKKFRQALNLSINKELMLKTFKFGIGVPANSGFIPIGLPVFDSITQRGFNYLPDSAKNLLSEIEYSGLSKENKSFVVYTNKEYLDLITYVTRQWQEMGIDVQIELMETATLREKMRSGTLSMFRGSWIADYPEEESFLTVFYGENPAPPNYTRFNNEQFNRLYNQAIGQSNMIFRQTLYKEMNQILIDEAPVIFLMYDQFALFVQNNIEGIKPNPLNLLRLENVNKINRE